MFNIKVPKPTLAPTSHLTSPAVMPSIPTVYKAPNFSSKTVRSSNVPIEIEPNSLLHIPFKAACSIHVKSSSFDELKAQVEDLTCKKENNFPLYFKKQDFLTQDTWNRCE